jgi:hypothetical protein
VSGKSFVKWSLPHSTATEHRGRTEKHSIKEHKCTYDWDFDTSVRLVIDKNGYLQESWMLFEVQHEVSSGGKGERLTLGTVRLNLAEYVEASEQEGEDGVCRRYLMQDSKINSTLKVSNCGHRKSAILLNCIQISVSLKQVEGDRNFIP